MSCVRRVSMSCESVKGMKPKGITECESDPQRDHLESLRDLAALLTLEMGVCGVRKTEKIILILGGQLRDCCTCDAVGSEEVLTRRGGEIEPLESLGEEEFLKGNREGGAVAMAHTFEELIAERVRLLGGGDQVWDLAIRHTKRPLDDPEDLRKATNKRDMDIWGVAQDIVQGEARQTGFRRHREGTPLGLPWMMGHTTSF